MKKKDYTEKIYDLIEMFDYDDLSKQDQEYVMKNMSSEEYTALRSTVNDMENYFSKMTVEQQRKPGIRKLIFYPVELYKIAAAVILLAGILFFISKSRSANSQKMMAYHTDTVFVEKTDTVMVQITDTVEKIEQEIIYKTVEAVSTTNYHFNLPETQAYFETDCAKELCPADMQTLNILTSKNNFSNDKELTDFVVKVN